MNTTHTNTEIIPQQIKAFSNWVSSNLSQARSSIKVNDVTKDFKNGVALVELSQILVGKSDSLNLELCPKEADDIVHNCDVAIDMLTKDGVHLGLVSTTQSAGQSASATTGAASATGRSFPQNQK